MSFARTLEYVGGMFIPSQSAKNEINRAVGLVLEKRSDFKNGKVPPVDVRAAVILAILSLENHGKNAGLTPEIVQEKIEDLKRISSDAPYEDKA